MESITTIGVHNTLALMLDPRFKGLKCVIDFFNHDKAKLLVVEYDNKILILLIMKCSYFLNPNFAYSYTSTVDGPSNFFFDTPIPSVEADEGLLLAKLFLFHRCVVNLSVNAGSLLLWWKEHARLYHDGPFLLNRFWQFLVHKLQQKDIFCG
jgi:hypothetical protein